MKMNLRTQETFPAKLKITICEEAKTIEAVFDNLSQFKTIVKNQVGIRVFRDGFGIKPFRH